MKKGIHPDNYREVIFEDAGTGAQFLILSGVETEETGTYEGKQYPLYRVEISSASHPFYTGKEKVMDSAGRVDKFRRRQEASKSKQGNK